MSRQESGFSAKQNRLLDIAGWAKYMAWFVLVVYFLYAAAYYTQEIQQQWYFSDQNNFSSGIFGEPLFVVKVLLGTFTRVINGVAWFLALKGISLGLNMIAETDINYREARSTEVENG